MLFGGGTDLENIGLSFGSIVVLAIVMYFVIEAAVEKAIKRAMSASTSEITCYKIEALFEHNTNLLNTAIIGLRRNEPEYQNSKEYLDQLRAENRKIYIDKTISDNQKLSGLTEISDKIQHVYEREEA